MLMMLHVAAVWMAMKGKMEITLGVAVGSSIQISVGVSHITSLVQQAIQAHFNFSDRSCQFSFWQGGP